MQRSQQEGAFFVNASRMSMPPMSDVTWRRTHMALTIILGLLIAMELLAAGSQFLQHHSKPYFGFELQATVGLTGLEDDTTFGRIEVLKEASGQCPRLREGQLLITRESPVVDRWRVPHKGERLRLDDAASGCSELVARHREPTLSEMMDYAGRVILTVLSFGFAIFVGRSQGHQPAYRRLSLVFMLVSLNLFFNFNFAPPEVVWPAKSVALVSEPWLYFLLADFALRYHPDRRTFIYRMRQWLMLALAILSVVASCFMASYLLGIPQPQRLTRLLAVQALCGQLVTFAALWIAKGRAVGEYRSRIHWCIVSVVLGFISLTGLWGASLLRASPSQLATGVPYMFGLGAASFAVLTYATLYRRVLDIVVILDGMTVATIVSGLLLTAFSLTKFLLEQYLHHSGLKEALLAVAIVPIYFAFHSLHERLTHLVRQALFRKLAAKKQAMRNFVEQAAHYADAESLLRDFHRALDAFNDGTGSVIYTRLSSGKFAQSFNSAPRASPLLDADDGLAVRLRATRKAQKFPESTSEARGALALPMFRGSQLMGIVVMSRKPYGVDYRDEEIQTLEAAVQQISQELQALTASRSEAAATVMATAPGI